jgi:hypothetical protein
MASCMRCMLCDNVGNRRRHKDRSLTWTAVFARPREMGTDLHRARHDFLSVEYSERRLVSDWLNPTVLRDPDNLDFERA